MTKIYHVMGSDIPHHNHTVLQFFAQQLRDKVPATAMAKFFVVGDGIAQKYPQLNIEEFTDKRHVSKALIRTAKEEPEVHFYLHGQFNFSIWLAVLFHRLPVERLTWHIWGADLYEDSQRLIYKLAYPLRRFVQKKFKHVVGTQGDINAFACLNPDAKRTLVYFPTKMDRTFQPSTREKNEVLTILLGNSGDHSNRHQEALAQIKAKLGENVRIIVPMGYPSHNEEYIAQVKTTAQKLFPIKSGKSAVEIIEQKMTFSDYLAMLTQCDLGYFIFHRQQGIGTICLLTQLNIPAVLHPKNTFTEDMKLNKVPFLYIDDVSHDSIVKVQEKLIALDKETIAFFDPYFIRTWPPVLGEILAK
ncbi:MAG TPA: hypothetical protein DD638_08695 [Pasteurellaceae bacterium]|nr:hypothetical protein [Pasteurellaceae bacterium]